MDILAWPSGFLSLLKQGVELLWKQFEQLEHGHSVALVPPDGPQVSQPPPGGPWVGFTSSGSTGRPKLVWRLWKELKEGASRKAEIQGWVWATSFEPWSFAGLQVAIQAWVCCGRIVFLKGSWDEIWQRLRQEHVDAISATPTFIDLLLQHEPQAHVAWKPQHITLGGEPLREPVGRRIAQRWPHTTVKVIYAAAEFGVIATTTRLDGWYPVASLSKRWPQWRVVDGVLELFVDGYWRSTGDRVEIQGELLRVVGRADRVANVAGTKVNLDWIAELAEQVPGVRRALAYSIPSPITGELVALRFEPEPGMDASLVQAALEQTLRQRLPKPAWPRRWECGPVPLGPNSKRALQYE